MKLESCLFRVVPLPVCLVYPSFPCSDRMKFLLQELEWSYMSVLKSYPKVSISTGSRAKEVVGGLAFGL